MKKYETTIVTRRPGAPDTIKLLNEFGQQGWHVVANYGPCEYILQRLIVEEEPK